MEADEFAEFNPALRAPVLESRRRIPKNFPIRLPYRQDLDISELSKNWAGRPLESCQTILSYARSTATSTGLAVKAYFVKRDYQSGLKISDDQMAHLRLRPHDTQPTRNYTLQPR